MFPSNPTTLHHPDALDALELGARRFDFIGLKFQLADEIQQGYTRAQQGSTAKIANRELSDIRGINGKLEDILDTYAPPPRPLRAGLAPLQPPLRPSPRPRPLRLHPRPLAIPHRQIPLRPTPIFRLQNPPNP